LRRIGVEMHGEQPTLDEIGLRWLPQPDRDIRFAHREIKLFIG